MEGEGQREVSTMNSERERDQACNLCFSQFAILITRPPLPTRRLSTGELHFLSLSTKADAQAYLFDRQRDAFAWR